MTKILTGSGCGSLSMARGIRGRTVWGPLEKQIQAVSIPRQLVKLEFGPQGGRPSRALDMCNRSFPLNLGMIAPGNHWDFDSLRAAPPARYRSMVR